MKPAFRLILFLLASSLPSWGLCEPPADSADAVGAKLPDLLAAYERTKGVEERVALAIAYEQTGDRERALVEAFAVVKALAEKGAGKKTEAAALTKALLLVERIRVSREAAPVELILPARCIRPVVEMGEQNVEIQGTTARLPPSTGDTTRVTIECGDEADLGPQADWTPYLWGGAAASAVVSLYFTARYLGAESDLETPDPIIDPRDLGPAAQQLTRARQARDDFGEAALISGLVAAALGGASLYFWFDGAPVTPAPEVTNGSLGLVLRGQF